MLNLTNVIQVSVALAPTGLGEYNVNNIALFTSEQFLVNTNNDDYRVYVSPSDVATDFGTGTEPHNQATAIFSQNPNILAGGGNLIIFPMIPASSSSSSSSSSSAGTSGGGGGEVVISAETLEEAIDRTKDMIFYCGIISDNYPASGDMKTLADYIQGLGDKILFLPSATYADVAGAFTAIKAASDYATRCLYYSTTAADARLFAAAYAGRAMSVNFDGSRTTMTMHFKSLATIDPDEGITQTILTALGTAGVDAYVDIAGIPMAFSEGANRFFDDVYNLIWLVSQLKVNGFNALRQLSTKIPQTEPGMSLLKSAYRQALDQAVTNGYVAPGAWTSSEWFGNQEDMYNNIIEKGYYIYSQPVNLQSAADRADRKAPLIQIAIKEAGAIHSSNVVVNINQ